MASVCVHGMGHIGLPTATVLAKSGHKVFGYDSNSEKRLELASGTTGLNEENLDAMFHDVIESGDLIICDEVVEADYHLICVPTPLTKNNDADLSYLIAAAENVAGVIRSGDNIIIESTVPPGTTINEVSPVIEAGGKTPGKQLGIAYSPETVIPGNTIHELKNNDRIVGGIDPGSTKAAKSLYNSFTNGEIHCVVNPTIAEFVKIAQNTYRDVNIALANEMAKIARDYGINSRKVINLANQHPRVDLLRPGPGVGGHCLPVDPWFLSNKSNNLDLVSKARRINDSMTDYIISLLFSHIKPVELKKIAILGIAYKGNVSDTRGGPGLQLYHRLNTLGESAEAGEPSLDSSFKLRVSANDPHVTESKIPLEKIEESLDGADAVIISADHKEYLELTPSYIQDLMQEGLLIDTKGIMEVDSWAGSNVELLQI